jgi:hypothetical protein
LRFAEHEKFIGHRCGRLCFGPQGHEDHTISSLGRRTLVRTPSMPVITDSETRLIGSLQFPFLSVKDDRDSISSAETHHSELK